MFSIQVETEFAAAHALRIAGAMEPLHGHNWRVVVTIAGPTLDPDGLLCDFHTVHEKLELITKAFDNANLNEVVPFAGPDGSLRINPSAEQVARVIAEALAPRIAGALGPYGSRIASVSVSEAPRCVATYSPVSRA